MEQQVTKTLFQNWMQSEYLAFGTWDAGAGTTVDHDF